MHGVDIVSDKHMQWNISIAFPRGSCAACYTLSAAQRRARQARRVLAARGAWQRLPKSDAAGVGGVELNADAAQRYRAVNVPADADEWTGHFGGG